MQKWSSRAPEIRLLFCSSSVSFSDLWLILFLVHIIWSSQSWCQKKRRHLSLFKLVCRDLHVGWDFDVWLILSQRFAGWKIVLVSFSLTPWTCKMIRASSKTTSWIRGKTPDHHMVPSIELLLEGEQYDRLQDGKDQRSEKWDQSSVPVMTISWDLRVWRHVHGTCMIVGIGWRVFRFPRKLQHSPGPKKTGNP